MAGKFSFAIVSDLHIATASTIVNHPKRFHLVEVSIPAFELILSHLEEIQPDFLLLPGDLTQDGEPENHQWLKNRLESLSFPVYVIPGNHDVPTLLRTDKTIAFPDFPNYYRQYGYQDTEQLYYTCEPIPGVQLISLNSNQFDQEGKQLGCLDDAQLEWLAQTLTKVKDKLVLVMIHHNVIEHLPGQSKHSLGKRYMLDNAATLKQLLREFAVKLIFTGHLHVQDIAYEDGLYEITTGSIVSYPHPYRLIEVETNSQGETTLNIQSHRVEAVPGWENLLHTSREWMGDRSFPFMFKLLTGEPLQLSPMEAELIAPKLRYFWADIAQGDSIFSFPHFPEPVREYLHQFSAHNTIDNRGTIVI